MHYNIIAQLLIFGVCVCVLIEAGELQALYAGDSSLSLVECVVDRVLLYAGLDTSHPLHRLIFIACLEPVELMVT